MRELPFSALSSCGMNIGNISCVERSWGNKWGNEYPVGRDTNVLSFTLHGHKRLFLPNEPEPLFEVDGPSAFLITRGSPYLSRSTSSDGQSGQTICIKFNLYEENGEEILISDRYLCFCPTDSESITHLFRKVMHAYLEANINYFSLKSNLFRLLDALLSTRKSESRMQRGFDDLLPALNRLETEPYGHLTVDELAAACFMSKSYFCKRFKQYSGGESFTAYRNRLRIGKAVELLGNPLWSMDMIAQTLGFYDTSHFYRVFKQYTGETPKDYQRE